MSDKKYFKTVAYTSPSDPLLSIKQKISKKIRTLDEDFEDEDEQTRKKEVLETMVAFVKFIEESRERLAVFRKSYNPLELDNGAGEIIMDICDYSNSKVNLSESSLVELKQFLQIPDEEMSEHYFENSALDNVYLWYKKGGTHTEDFGEVVDDEFKGFVLFNT